jgi:hypothetical protein
MSFKNKFKKSILIAILFLFGVAVLAAPRKITLNSLTPNILCQGLSTLVNFTVAGNYNFGNKFNVELSDNLGNFSSPTIIGSLFSTNSGTFTVTTDPIIVIGTGYRIRVRSTNQVVTSGSLSIKIYLHPALNPIIKLY